MPCSAEVVVVAKTSVLAPVVTGDALSHIVIPTIHLCRKLLSMNWCGKLVLIMPGQTELTMGDGLLLVSLYSHPL